jgi:hypothetical protein
MNLLAVLLLVAAPASARVEEVNLATVDSRLAVRVALSGQPGVVVVHREGDAARVSIAETTLGTRFAGGSHFAWTPAPDFDLETLSGPTRLDRLEVMVVDSEVSIILRVPPEVSIDLRRDRRGLLLVFREEAAEPEEAPAPALAPAEPTEPATATAAAAPSAEMPTPVTEAVSRPLAPVAATATAEPSARALRIDQEIEVDGLLDEPAWSVAEPATGFRQMEPREGEPATEPTEVIVLYDAKTLFVGVRALDREPDRILARILERDRVIRAGLDSRARFAEDDAVALVFDTFHDHRNAFIFATNPNGAEFDGLITDERSSYNIHWRGVWEVAARRTLEGWSAEFAIPFRSLRYPPDPGEQTWGFNVERMIRRKNEQTLWSAWTRGEGGLHRVSQAGNLLGLAGLPRSRLNLEVKPYGLAGLTRERQDDGGVPTERDTSFGLDAKWEVRPGIVLDGTLNPDFAQVEADQEIVNLTRFDLFLPERREFFLENAGIFEFGTRSPFEPPPFLMFFSRRIGISEDDGEIPVLGGVRLSGRAGRQTIGLLNITTDAAFEEPRTNFATLRVKRDVGSSGYVGAMLTDRRRREDAETDGGVDFSLWPTPRLNITGFAALTSAYEEREADRAYRLGVDYRSDRVRASGQHIVIGPDAETGMGFVTRTDIRKTDGLTQYIFRPSALGLRQIETFAGGSWITRVTGEEQDGTLFTGAALEWHSGDSVGVFYEQGFTELDEAFDLADRIPVPPGRYDVRRLFFFGGTSRNRRFRIFSQGAVTNSWGGDLDFASLRTEVNVGKHLAAGLDWTLSRADLPGGAFTAHVFGVRASWAFSTRLVTRAYVQYNSLDRKWITNLRLRLIHRPGSDLYFVFNDEQGEEDAPGRLVNRGFAVKGTWLVRF